MGTPQSTGTARQPTPRDPETFFKAQQHNRRATWRMTALSVVAALLMGIPLTLVLTPFLYAVAMLVAEVINHFSPLPPEFWRAASNLAHLAYRVADVAINQRGTLDPQELAVALALIFLPGIALALALWVGIRLLFRHAGVGGTLASLNAREPNPADLKELQLADAVQEMAIAAGLAAPKVMLIDSPGANAAAIGTSPNDAHIVLSRRLIDDLNREQLQALIAHLVASVGNGDLHIAFTVTSVFETCGLIVALINAPFGRQSRSTLWKIVLYPFRRRDPRAKAADAEEVAELLADMMDTNQSDIERFFDSRNPGLIKKALRIVFFPIQITNVAVELTLWFFLNVLLGPCMALVWRSRRYLADASCVELTRDPDALASALQRLCEGENTVAGGAWAQHLFVVNPKGDRSMRRDGPSTEQQRNALKAWQALGSAGAGPAAVASPVLANSPSSVTSIATGMDPQQWLRIRKEMMATVMAAASGDAAAAARVQAFVQTMGGPATFGLQGMPDFNDILLAQRGDRAAMARLRMLKQSSHREDAPRRGRAGLQTYSYVSFHPPLERRAKRLQRMGAHIDAPKRRRSIFATMAFAVLYAIVGPLMVVAGAMMLFVIALMIGLNLMLLALWLTIIHWAFAQDWERNVQGIVAFVQEVSAAVSKSR